MASVSVERGMSNTLRNTLSQFTGRQLLRIEMIHGTGSRTIDWGETKWRVAPMDLDIPDAQRNAVLCELVGLDPHRCIFDLPRSARGTGSARSGFGGSSRGARQVDGFIFRRGPDGKPDGDPIGKVIFETEGANNIRDVDPQDRREFERLGG